MPKMSEAYGRFITQEEESSKHIMYPYMDLPDCYPFC